MIALRRFAREEWEAKLRGYDCRPLEGKGALNTAEFWQAPWGGYPFTVPVEDGYISQLDLDLLISNLMAAAPPGYTF